MLQSLNDKDIQDIGNAYQCCNNTLYIGPNIAQLTLTISIFVSIYASYAYSLYLQEWNTTLCSIAGIDTLLFLAAMGFAFSAAMTNPGIVPKHSLLLQEEYQPLQFNRQLHQSILFPSLDLERDSQLSPDIDPNLDQALNKDFQLYPPDYCMFCRSRQPADSKHCRTCNNCILGFDHHCPWLSNCIGIRNYTVYYLFLLTCTLWLVLTLFTLLLALPTPSPTLAHIPFIYAVSLGSLALFVTSMLLVYHTHLIRIGMSTYQHQYGLQPSLQHSLKGRGVFQH